MARMPWANWLLILITCVVSISLFSAEAEWEHDVRIAASMGLPAPVPDGALNNFILQPGNFSAWQLAGAVLVHAGWIHLVGNMLFLWIFGNAVNAKIGHWQYLLLYFGAAVLQSLIWLEVGPHLPELGASGAIMAIVGAFLLLYPLNDISCLFWFITVVRPVQFSAGWLIGLYAFLDLYGAIFKQHAGVAYLAHVTGFLVGAGLIGLMLWRHWLEPARGERTLLQVLGWMPEDPESIALVREDYLRPRNTHDGRPAVSSVPPMRRPPPKPRDESPIPLD